MKALIFIAFLFTTSLSAFGSNFALTSSYHISKFLGEITDILPQELKNKLDRKIEIKFKQIDNVTEINPKDLCELSTDSTKYHFGYVKKFFWQPYNSISTIYVNKALLPAIKRGKKDAPALTCRSKDMYSFAKSVIIHELTHLYDFQTNSKENSAISSSSEYLYLAGFKLVEDTPLEEDVESYDENDPTFRIVKKNKIIVRSPDPYEYTNRFEHFAVNFPLFLMDPDYKCKRPSLYQYFAKRFKHTPFPSYHCAVNYKVPVLHKQNKKLISIDPKRIYRIDYMVAGEGKQAMSRWGHSMFRIIMCAPFRKEVSKECLKDISHHVVLSFVAEISELSMSAIKGLTGKYPSRLTFSSLPTVIKQYTDTELRNLYSYPLNLTREEITLFTTRAIETYWQYRGKYYFLSNNCAVESLDLIKSILPLAQSVITPQELKDLLVDSSVISDLSAENNNKKSSLVFFKSKSDKYEHFYSILKDNYALTQTLDQFIQQAPEGIFNEVLKDGQRKSLYALYLITQISTRRQEKKLQAYIIEHKEYFKSTFNQLEKLNSQKYLILSKSYGIPFPNEVKPNETSEKLNYDEIIKSIQKDHNGKQIYTRYLQLTKEANTLKQALLKSFQS
jgi:hypothetical protein